MMLRLIVAAAFFMTASIAQARTVKVCTPSLSQCVTIKLPTRGCKTVMGYKICR